MERKEFLSNVSEELINMSEQQKDDWILNCAKLISEYRQEDFLISLQGKKLLIDMPTIEEIDLLCKKIYEGEIFVEYETHYYEFDEQGFYIDDWKSWYNDPCGVFNVLNKILVGCHNLLKLEKYDMAYRILDKVCRLQFQIQIAEDSEDTDAEENFSMINAFKENLIDMGEEQIGFDWCVALLMKEQKEANQVIAEKLIEILENETFKSICLSKLQEYISTELLSVLKNVLIEKIEHYTNLLEQVEEQRWKEKYFLERKLSRCQFLQMDIDKNIDSRSTSLDMVNGLEKSWEKIKNLLRILSYEPYIDDQLEIDGVWEICEELLKRKNLTDEKWSLRKKILEELIEHEYYDNYGCYDPLKELSEKLYASDKEVLEVADILNRYEHSSRKAAEIYKKYGKVELYVEYLKKHLGRSCKEYLELMEYYRECKKELEAIQIAEEGIKQCKDDLTGLYIFLLDMAKKEGNIEKYKKLYASAKRRKKVDIWRINEKYNQ